MDDESQVAASEFNDVVYEIDYFKQVCTNEDVKQGLFSFIDSVESTLMWKVEDAFRHTLADIAEHGHSLQTRLTPAYKPITKVQDVEFPAPEML